MKITAVTLAAVLLGMTALRVTLEPQQFKSVVAMLITGER